MLIGFFFLFVGWPDEPVYNQVSLKKITFELSADIFNVKSKGTRTDYRLFSREYENTFVIVKGSIGRGKYGEISNLKKGQTVDCYISLNAFNNLGLDEDDILVRGLSVGGQSLLSEKEFISNQGSYEKRQSILFLTIGVLFILNGLFSIPKEYTYLAVGLLFIYLLTIKT